MVKEWVRCHPQAEPPPPRLSCARLLNFELLFHRPSLMCLIKTQTRPNRLHTHTHPPKRLAHPRSPIPPLSALTSRATHAHPTSPRSTGFGAIWDCISSSSMCLIFKAVSATFTSTSQSQARPVHLLASLKSAKKDLRPEAKRAERARGSRPRWQRTPRGRRWSTRGRGGKSSVGN